MVLPSIPVVRNENIELTIFLGFSFSTCPNLVEIYWDNIPVINQTDNTANIDVSSKLEFMEIPSPFAVRMALETAELDDDVDDDEENRFSNCLLRNPLK